MRVFLKPQGQEADLEEPLIVKDDSTVENVCNNLHRDFVRKFRFARVKGPSAKFDWQRGIRPSSQRWGLIVYNYQKIISLYHFSINWFGLATENRSGFIGINEQGSQNDGDSKSAAIKNNVE